MEGSGGGAFAGRWRPWCAAAAAAAAARGAAFSGAARGALPSRPLFGSGLQRRRRAQRARLSDQTALQATMCAELLQVRAADSPRRLRQVVLHASNLQGASRAPTDRSRPGS